MKAAVREALGAAIQYGFGAAPLLEEFDFLEGPALLFQEPLLESYNEMPTAKQVRRWVWEHRHLRVMKRPSGFLWVFHGDEDWIIGLGALLPRGSEERAQALFPQSYTEL